MAGCMADGCKFDDEFVLARIDNGEKRVVLCTNHQIVFADNLFDNPEAKAEKSETQPMNCEICGDKGISYEDSDTEFHLCESHLFRLLRRDLKPLEFKTLYNRVGDVYLLHSDFYNPRTGYARQPVRVEKSFDN
ncbi:hypothetical protein PP175_25960 (plasmid) [Aneurinibacillus sp. Ricciae_BoGa-3]|uniref:hypothetical protein n=1 Tax=Aneurinibacillus sp. Ricciae_BoGa-3 TaxID=3022697 RepID=UPI0023407C8C|nr:hypothetical protein [Aneurinibacillus sp. Ricciae_BoGa-3]WCK57515.1 hypothetical protein PP175_25960 [Aneurinibacillus sp. Ricciae_BoGa-3]